MRSSLLTSIVVPEPAASAAQVRARATAAELSTVPSPGPTRRKLMAGALAVVVLPLVTTGALQTSGYAAPRALVLEFDGEFAPAARLWLGKLLSELMNSPGAADSPSPQQVFVHFQEWSMDLFEPEPVIIAQDMQIWWRPDRSAVTVSTDIAQPPRERNAIVNVANVQTVVKKTFPSGEFFTYLDEPPSSDPVLLLRQIEGHEPGANGPQSVLRAIADFRTRYHFDRQQRIAALEVLQDVEGIVFRGNTVDRAGRNGLAFSVDSPPDNSGQTRDLVILDEDARLLSHETMHLVSPPKLHLLPKTVTAYKLFF